MKKKSFKNYIQWKLLIWVCVLFAFANIEKIYGGGYFDNFNLYQNTLAQQKTVTGKVTDSDGVPLPGVSVVVKGEQNRGVATDFDGNYSIEVSSGQVLVFSYIGFATQEVKVGSISKINVILKADTEELDEVVVVGYGTMRKRDLTGSVVSLKPDKDDAATATSFDNLLEGKAAGINISSAGSTPGGATSIIIRGANSLVGDSQPLYVIDNVPQSSTGETMRSSSGDFQTAQDPLAGINPNDIEDIQVLKDASATAIYGSRGANGVILITTKKGKEGKTKVSMLANATIATATDLVPMMNLKEYAEYRNEYNPSDKVYEIVGNEVFYTYNYDDKDSAGNTVVEEAREKIRYRNWLKEALRTAFSTNYGVSVNGGTKKFRYNASVGYKDVEGIVKNTGLRHSDFRLNLGVDLSEKITLNMNTSGFLRENNMMSGGNTIGRTTGAIIPTALNSQPFILPARDKNINEDNRTTVLSWITDYEDITKEYRYSLSGDLRYKFNNNLSYTIRAGGNINNLERTNWYGIELWRGLDKNGVLTKGTLDRNNYNIENLLNYNQTFGKTNISATAGITYDAYEWVNKNLEGYNFPYYRLKSNGLSVAKNINIKDPIQKDYQLLSYLGRLNLSFFNGRYIFTGTFRGDATSKFNKENRWAYFPSFSTAWNIKEEKFLKDNEYFSQLKLRLGYGVTGSQNIDPYVTIFGYGASEGYANADGTKVNGLSIERISNPNLKWETTASYNAGIDLGFFNNRITTTIDVYSKITSDLLVNISLPGSSSFNSLAVNNGEISNKGVEVSLNLGLINTKDFKWNLSGNITLNRTKIESLGVPYGSYPGIGDNVKLMRGSFLGTHFGTPNIFVEGMAPGLFYGYETDGIVQVSDEESYKKAVGTSLFSTATAPGNLKYVDKNNDGEINDKDITIIGDPNPDFTYGFSTSMKYKNLRFSAQFTGVKGGDILNTNMRYRSMAARENAGKNIDPTAFINRWTETNTNTNYPALKSNIINGIIIDRYLEDGSYLRCTDITIGYNISSEILKNTKLFNNLDFYISVKNAFTLTNYSGFDVTSRSFNLNPLFRGIDAYSFPTQRAYIVGATINF